MTRPRIETVVRVVTRIAGRGVVNRAAQDHGLGLRLGDSELFEYARRLFLPLRIEPRGILFGAAWDGAFNARNRAASAALNLRGRRARRTVSCDVRISVANRESVVFVQTQYLIHKAPTNTCMCLNLNAAGTRNP